MKFVVKATEMKKAVEAAAKVVKTSPDHPSLVNLKVVAGAQGLEITGGDGKTTVVTKMAPSEENGLKVEKEGEILINAKFLVDVLKRLAGNDAFEIRVDGTQIRLEAGGAKYAVRSLDVKSYQTPDMKRPAQGLAMPKEMLKAFVDEVYVCAGHNEATPVLNGIHFVTRDGEMIVEATDTHSYAAKTIKYGGKPMNCVVPGEAIQIAVTQLEGDTIKLGVDEKKIQFFDDTTLIQSTLYSGNYPNTAKLVDAEAGADKVLTVDRKALLAAIDRCSLMKEDGNTVVRFTMSKDGLDLQAKSQDFGEFTDHLDAEYKGEDFAISLVGDQIAATLKAIGGETATIKFIAALKPVIFRGGKDNLIHIVTPIRTIAD